MKRAATALMVLGLVCVTVLATDVDAGWLGKSKNKRLSDKRTEKPEWMKSPVRYDVLPAAEFNMGRLNRSSFSGWELGKFNLVLAKDCVISRNGVETGMLEEGRSAIVMGPRAGNTVVAWSVRILEPDYSNRSVRTDVKVEPSAVDPDVGVIISSPY